MTHGVDDVRKQVQDRIDQEAAKIAPQDEEQKITSAFIQECLFSNELGDARLYSTLFRNKLLFCKNNQQWFLWNGHTWERDFMGRALVSVEKVVACYLSEYKAVIDRVCYIVARGNPDPGEIQGLRKQQANLLKRASQLRADKRRTACLKFAHTIGDDLAISGESFDNKPMLFPCTNGVIDLETGKLKPGRPGDYLSMRSPVNFFGIDAPAPVWERSLLEIFDGNEAIIAYLQRLFGYAMTGLVDEKIFSVLYGPSGFNGRTLIIESIAHVLGDLAASIPSELLLLAKYSKSASSPSPEIMILRGLRMAFASEIDEGQKFSAAKIKLITGKDTLYGRNPHDRFGVHFAPSHKLFLSTNAQPSAPANDKAFWERLHMIFFNISFVNRDPQEAHERRSTPDLDRQLRQEASGILSWLVRGCLEWQKHGLKPPREVKEAGQKYRGGEDFFSDFIEECCYTEPGARERSSVLYERFVQWFRSNVGRREPSGIWFAKQIIQKFPKRKSCGISTYLGIGLRPDPD